MKRPRRMRHRHWWRNDRYCRLYERRIRHTSVIPVGGNLITKDLSKSLRTPLDAAEYIKIHYGVASCDTEGLGEMIEVPGVGDRTSRQVSSKVLAAIISARIQEIFGVVLGELQKSGFPKKC